MNNFNENSTTIYISAHGNLEISIDRTHDYSIRSSIKNIIDPQFLNVFIEGISEYLHKTKYCIKPSCGECSIDEATETTSNTSEELKIIYNKNHNFLFLDTNSQRLFKNWDEIILSSDNV